MKLKILLLLLILQILVVKPVFAEENPILSTGEDSTEYDEEDLTVFPRFEFEARYWRPTVTGSLKLTERGIGSNINVKDDLGIEDADSPEARLTWHTGPNSSLRFSYLRINYDGHRQLGRTIEFQGQTYTIGTTISSTLDFEYSKLDWIWQFASFRDGKVKVGSLIDIAFNRVATIRIKSQDGLIDADESYVMPSGAIGVVLDAAPYEWLGGFAEISGLPLGQYGHTLNAEIGLKFIPIKHIAVDTGYRYTDIEYSVDPDYGNLNFNGPFASLTARF